LLSYQNSGIAVYDWNTDRIVEEIDDINAVKSLTISSNKVNQRDRIAVCGSEAGAITIL
jgi:hypothetical protein